MSLNTPRSSDTVRGSVGYMVRVQVRGTLVFMNWVAPLANWACESIKRYEDSFSIKNINTNKKISEVYY